MKKMLLIFFLVFLAPAFSQSREADDEILAAFISDSLWHVIDYYGADVFPPVDLDAVTGYSDGLIHAAKMQGDTVRWLFLDESGEIVLESGYDKVGHFQCGRLIVTRFHDDTGFRRTYGFIDKAGNEIVPPDCREALDFSEGKAWVSYGSRQGYIDTSGIFVLELDDLIGGAFNGGIARVSNSDYFMGYINTTGKLIIDCMFDEAHDFSEGLAAVHMDGDFGYIDRRGRIAVKPKYDKAMPFSEGRAFVGITGKEFRVKWGLIDSSGKNLTPIHFDLVGRFSDGLAPVKKDGKWGYIDKHGVYAIEPEFYFAAEFIDGIAWASDHENGRYGFIDKEGKFLFEIPKPLVIIDLRLNRRMY